MKVTRQPSHYGVVVGVDGSAASCVAARWAARDAALRDVALTVVYVSADADDAPRWAEVAIPEQVRRAERLRGQRIIRQALDSIASAMPDGGPAATDWKVLCGNTVETLVDLSRDAALVVVGSRGLGALARTLVRSVSSGLVHDAHCPVAVIHHEDPLADHPSRAPVVVGIDGSPASELATSMAFDEASWRRVDLVALHACRDTDRSDYRDVDVSTMVGSAEETLAERLAGWQERYPDVAVHRIVVPDHPVRHLLDQSKASQLVVVGSHGRGALGHVLLGSVSSAVVHGARTPVIVARHQ